MPQRLDLFLKRRVKAVNPRVKRPFHDTHALGIERCLLAAADIAGMKPPVLVPPQSNCRDRQAGFPENISFHALPFDPEFQEAASKPHRWPQPQREPAGRRARSGLYGQMEAMQSDDVSRSSLSGDAREGFQTASKYNTHGCHCTIGQLLKTHI
jgi:hypothetical protein